MGDRICGIHKEVPIVPEVRHQMIFADTTGAAKCLEHLFGQLRPEIAVVPGVNPKHGVFEPTCRTLGRYR